ncbi:MAG: ketol-acid reductoisomerase [Fimbriimonadaceae bacterium]|nr:ketol-acid reductoisomerase [Fimbriimonadaceae bacterium]
MTTIYHEDDANPAWIRSSKVAVIGYGSQGHAHALNLRDSGVDVRVALHAESKSRDRAREAGFEVPTVAEAARWADALMFCTPDVTMGDVYREFVAPNLRPGQLLLFAHGFSVHYGLIEAPAFVDVAMVAPKGPGHRLRAEFARGSGLFALVAVQQDASGRALERTLSYAWGIGCARLGMLETTFKEETETDLFGEQAVLCGGISALVKAGFETLVEAGYRPEAAYFECLHETKLIVDLLYEGGLSHMTRAISDTAEWGAYTAGPRVINDESRKAMRELLAEIQSGEFTRKWIAEDRAGRPNMARCREQDAEHPVEEVGRRLRVIMRLGHSR